MGLAHSPAVEALRYMLRLLKGCVHVAWAAKYSSYIATITSVLNAVSAAKFRRVRCALEQLQLQHLYDGLIAQAHTRSVLCLPLPSPLGPLAACLTHRNAGRGRRNYR
jgi:hypothetical protein